MSIRDRVLSTIQAIALSITSIRDVLIRGYHPSVMCLQKTGKDVYKRQNLDDILKTFVEKYSDEPRKE